MKKFYLTLIGLIIAVFASTAQTPEHLYLVGGFDGCDWNPTNAPEFTKTGENLFELKRIPLWSNNTNLQFQFTEERNWNKKYVAPSQDKDVTPTSTQNGESTFSIFVDDTTTPSSMLLCKFWEIFNTIFNNYH